jgi:Sap, sulfolipid-1-addressing protein
VSDATSIFAYGLVAAASPTVLLTTLAVLASGRGRINGAVFTFAFVVGQSLAYVAAFLLGAAVSPGEEGSGQLQGVLELAGGTALLVVGLQRLAGHRADDVGERRISVALFERLSRVGPAVSFGAGLPLGIGVKRLVITIVAGASVATAGVSSDDQVSLSVEYVLVATVVVWLPVFLYLLFGARSDRLMGEARTWITGHESGIAVGFALAVGAFLILDGLRQLL